MVIKNIRPAISSVCNMNCKYCSNIKGQNARMEDFRRSPLSEGVLSTEQWLKMFKSFYDAGFRGISLTGGEPMLNPDWLKMLKYCKEIGYLSTELTSNLLALSKYKSELKKVDYISKFKVSLDTFDKERFYYLTGVDGLNTVLDNVKYCVDLGFNVQLNRVTMRSTQNELVDYIKKANELGVNVNLLDLVFYKGSNSDNNVVKWANEYVPPEFTWLFLKQNINDFGELESDPRYGLRTSYGKTKIILKDSQLTKRSKKCERCPLYCQEGIFTVRIASDGTITTCPDYKNELPYIDGVAALNNQTLTSKLEKVFKDFSIQEENHFLEYVRRL